MNKIKKILTSFITFISIIILKVKVFASDMNDLAFNDISVQPMYGVESPSIFSKLTFIFTFILNIIVTIIKIALPFILFAIGLHAILSDKLFKKIKVIIILVFIIAIFLGFIAFMHFTDSMANFEIF